MNTEIDYDNFPASFIHCLNEQCLRGDECLRRQIVFHVPKERASFVVINPAHLESPTGEDCQSFLLDQPQRYACGITNLFDNIPHRKAIAIKAQMMRYFGRASYYRCYRKERLIKPKEQERIQAMFRAQDLNDEPQFDEFLSYYDLG